MTAERIQDDGRVDVVIDRTNREVDVEIWIRGEFMGGLKLWPYKARELGKELIEAADKAEQQG